MLLRDFQLSAPHTINKEVKNGTQGNKMHEGKIFPIASS